jgi:hypothetical protein
LNTQDEDIRKRKLDAFTDDILDKTATVIAEDLLQNYKALVGLASTDLRSDAKTIDKSANPAGRPKADDKEGTDAEAPTTSKKQKKKANKAETPGEIGDLRKKIKEGDAKAWMDTPIQDIQKIPNKKLTKDDLFSLAVTNIDGFNNTSTLKARYNKPHLIQLLKLHFEDPSADFTTLLYHFPNNEAPETKQQEADEDEEDDEVEDSDDGEDDTGAGFTPNRRSLLRLLK